MNPYDLTPLLKRDFRRQRLLQTTLNLYWPLKTAPLSTKHSVRTELGDIGGPGDSISKGIWAYLVMLPDADNEQTVERLRLLCAGNVQRLAVILMFVAVRLLQIREALMLPYSRKQKDDKIWNEHTPANRVVSDEEWKA